MKQPEGHHTLDETFGYQRVASDERSRRIRRVFEQVAPRYDLMNDLMSFGIHRLWKRNLVKTTLSQPVELLVDLAGGTGDVARQLRGAGRRVVIVDPSLAMMNAGRARTGAGVSYLAGIGESIPLADHSVDALTIAFGIRNVTSMPRALAEITRVLKPGGRCLCLEFSKPAAWLRPFYNAYSFLVIPRLGAWVARAPEAYTYLVESIRKFPDQEEMKALMETAGLSDVTFRNLSFGIACLHVGTKP
ncbi:MAG: class I SAM-dependent methyltransferase [Proteobacteria bacterium]|nr:MAG: class I SAM-dependent methyltransferase [Pseudomonadota bacterium]QKK10962.1 MAG: class I SAM-dependent methyltransferase [Pseudomonadota bacterium]